MHEAQFLLKHIDRDLHKVMDGFWDGPQEGRTCLSFGAVITRVPEFEVDPLGGG